jgi:hypothetical protein
MTTRSAPPRLIVEDFKAWWREHAPAHLREIDPDDLPPVDWQALEREELDAMRDRQAHARNVLWRERLPARYAAASLGELTEQQHPERVMPWLDSPSLTLLLAGPAGHGKTHAAYAVGNAAVHQGIYALAWTLADLNAAMRPGGAEPERTYERVAAAELLVIDDLGREQVTAWSLEVLQRLLDVRVRERRRNVVTTNLSYEEVVERYGTPIAERLIEEAVIVKVEGRSMRTVSPW